MILLRILKIWISELKAKEVWSYKYNMITVELVDITEPLDFNSIQKRPWKLSAKFSNDFFHYWDSYKVLRISK